MPARKLKEFLEREHVPYTSIAHRETYTAQETAEAAHVPGYELAKTVMVELDGQMAMVVVPATQKIVLQDLRDLTGAARVRFASEDQFKSLFPDCEIGAMPPFGNLYGIEVFVSPGLAADEEIAFNAGTHTEVIKMAYADFEHLVHPKVVSCTT
ncbi:MAG: YbaK/EbsC family protein [Verrucomicrobia bacterium]|nr:YbaK/EbsC family protein [Verrucomicrobiota bacterium]